MMVMQNDVDLASVRNRVPECGPAGGKRDHLVNFSTDVGELTFFLLRWLSKC